MRGDQSKEGALREYVWGTLAVDGTRVLRRWVGRRLDDSDY